MPKQPLLTRGLLTLLPQDHIPASRNKFAVIINHLPAKESLFYNSAQSLARIRRQLVAMMQRRRFNGEFTFRIPDHNVCVAAFRDRSFQIKSNLTRGRSTEPFDELQQIESARVRLCPRHRQAKL